MNRESAERENHFCSRPLRASRPLREAIEGESVSVIEILPKVLPELLLA